LFCTFFAFILFVFVFFRFTFVVMDAVTTIGAKRLLAATFTLLCMLRTLNKDQLPKNNFGRIAQRQAYHAALVAASTVVSTIMTEVYTITTLVVKSYRQCVNE
jgi:hypothetical protein